MSPLERAIVAVLRSQSPMAARDVVRILEPGGWWFLDPRVYVALYRLEDMGVVTSAWLPGHYPRTRVYQVTR